MGRQTQGHSLCLLRNTIPVALMVRAILGQAERSKKVIFPLLYGLSREESRPGQRL
jgi:hypothetical protein